MGDDDLLHQLAAIEREHGSGYPDEWEAVVAGEADAAAVAAARRGIDAPEDAALYAELFTPASDDAIAGLVERMAATLASAEAGAAASPQADAAGAAVAGRPPPILAAGPPVAEVAAPISLAERSARRRGLWVGASALLAAAAALVLWIRAPEPAPGGASLLTPYSLVVRNQEVRGERSTGASAGGDAATPARYRRDSQIHWILRPDEANPAAAGLGLVVWASDGAASRTLRPALARVGEGGVIELRGPLGELLPLPAGRWELRFGVGVGVSELGDDPALAARDPRIQVVGPTAIIIEE